ncbi:hypothetical protein Trydic_g21171 [Trypoxylus dichotomus]
MIRVVLLLDTVSNGQSSLNIVDIKCTITSRISDAIIFSIFPPFEYHYMSIFGVLAAVYRPCRNHRTAAGPAHKAAKYPVYCPALGRGPFRARFTAALSGDRGALKRQNAKRNKPSVTYICVAEDHQARWRTIVDGRENVKRNGRDPTDDGYESR